MKTIKVDLLNIDKAIAEVDAYKREVSQKCELAKSKIAERMERGARSGFASATIDETRTPNVSVFVQDNGNVVSIIAQGEDAVFVEFGAGVYYNTSAGTSPHPEGAELGLTIGSYGWGAGQFDKWGYRDKNGNVVWTHGTPASMPMWRAFESALNDIPTILREVFA